MYHLDNKEWYLDISTDLMFDLSFKEPTDFPQSLNWDKFAAIEDDSMSRTANVSLASTRTLRNSRIQTLLGQKFEIPVMRNAWFSS